MAEQNSTLTHYTTTPNGAARCDASDTAHVSPYPDEVTCPACLPIATADQHATTIRAGVERAANGLSSAVTNLSMWEGRGQWIASPEQTRREAAERALGQLGDVIDALTGWRDTLSSELATQSNQSLAEPST